MWLVQLSDLVDDNMCIYRTDDTNMVHHLYACVCAHVQIDMVAVIQKVLRCIYGEQLGHELDGQEENGRQRQNF